MFVSLDILTPVHGFPFVPFSWVFFPFFVIQPQPFWTPFSYSNYLTTRYHIIVQCCFFSINILNISLDFFFFMRSQL